MQCLSILTLTVAMMFSVSSCFDSRTASSRRETFSQKKFKPMGTPPQVSVAFTAEDREFLWSGTGVFCAAGTPSRGFRTVGSTGFRLEQERAHEKPGLQPYPAHSHRGRLVFASVS